MRLTSSLVVMAFVSVRSPMSYVRVRSPHTCNASVHARIPSAGWPFHQPHRPSQLARPGAGPASDPAVCNPSDTLSVVADLLGDAGQRHDVEPAWPAWARAAARMAAPASVGEPAHTGRQSPAPMSTIPGPNYHGAVPAGAAGRRGVAARLPSYVCALAALPDCAWKNPLLVTVVRPNRPGDYVGSGVHPPQNSGGARPSGTRALMATAEMPRST